jgi:ATP-binding cassette subfamily B multidrug efflux pump
VHADEIDVLRHGTIIERGTHADLMAANGFYAQLYRDQMPEL